MAHMIALGRTIAMLPRSLVDPAPPGLVCVPVTDAPPSRLVIAWPEHDRRALLASFVTAARDAAATTTLANADEVVVTGPPRTVGTNRSAEPHPLEVGGLPSGPG